MELWDFRPSSRELSSNLPQLPQDPQRRAKCGGGRAGLRLQRSSKTNFSLAGAGRSVHVCLSLNLFLITPPKKEADTHSGRTPPNEPPSFSFAGFQSPNFAHPPPYGTCVCLSCLCTLLPTEFPANIRKAAEIRRC